jgi:hypothetical protein
MMPIGTLNHNGVVMKNYQGADPFRWLDQDENFFHLGFVHNLTGLNVF